MKSLKLFLWNYLLKHLPGFTLRKAVFRYFMGNKIPWNSTVHRGIDLLGTGGIRIGSKSIVNKFASLDGRGMLTIGDCVSISAYAKIITASHDPQSGSFDFIVKPVVIEDYVWVGTAAIILPGVTLKKGCVVAAGSVVTKDVEEFTIVGGNPAKFLKNRTKELNYNPFWEPWYQ